MKATTRIDPIFADLLAGAIAGNLATARAYSAAAAPPIDADRLAYEAALRRHDWTFEYSDDHSVYTRGRQALIALRAQQARIDPAFVIWNSIAPAGYRNGAVIV